ncbi:PEP-CTERM sorting domain-containing protein [Aliiglaciecola lipolytica]|uniref:Ice-binding protein C-terminal domain-containing protein n=1 Tax=Aliiglaciecola lipolytica E3 TaxID=1127673 RepID=K6YDF0_9ALTE|nr:PEP-CTERM sorting domain-containing protein [Aliiglaciecola lipolytica]GAC14673.1 hypothetical protein GLIP_2045 [Aliiglaciecola lipolytica E3]
MEIAFNESLSSFGGYFNSLFTTTSSTISFFDDGNLIAQDDITVGFGNYNWQGWEATQGSAFDSVVISHSSITSSSFLIFDALRANKAVVPEPSTLAILALGLIGLASRKFKKS